MSKFTETIETLEKSATWLRESIASMDKAILQKENELVGFTDQKRRRQASLEEIARAIDILRMAE